MANSPAEHPADRAARLALTCTGCGERAIVRGVCAQCGATVAPSANSGSRGAGGLEPIDERVMLEIPRGRDGREALCFRFVRAKTAEGKMVAWHDLREFYKGADGAWLPGKKGISIRGKELHAVAIALLRAVASSVPASLHESARAIVAALGGSPPSPPRPAVGRSEPSDEECGF